jgi:flagellar hook-associated protein FlgK
MNGASISSLSDYIDDAAFKNLLNSNSDSNYYNTLSDALGELEGIADDLGDNGLNKLLNDFYAAAANLEQFPTDMSVRQQYVLAAQNVCEKFNAISSKCDSIQQDKFHTVGTNVELMNNILSNIADANLAHVKNGTSATQADINNLLQELSQYTDVATTVNENGSVNVLIGGVAVVQGCEQKFNIEVELDSNNPDSAVTFSLRSTENSDYVITDGVNDAFKSGTMKAYVDFLNGSGGSKYTNVNDMKSALNEAASAFAACLNDIQMYDDGNSFAASLKTGDDGNLLLEKALVTVIPCESFAAPEYVRLSYAISDEDIVKGVGRIGAFVRAMES